jgi:transposase-like protein
MARRKYSWNFKAEVLAVYEIDGPAATARLYKMPVRTLKSWATRLGMHTGAETKDATEAACMAQKALRESIRAKVLRRADEMLDRMGEPMKVWVGSGATPVEVEIDKPSASVCKDLATTFGILLDKYRLEQGEATGREEVTVDGAAGARELLALHLARLAERRGTDNATGESDG